MEKKDIEEYELERARKQGIYEKAEEQLKAVIEGLMSGFEGYDVVFVR